MDHVQSALRRSFLVSGSAATLSAAAIGLLAGVPGLARAQAGDSSKDIGILNVALGLEHEAINAYQLGAQSGLLQKPVLDIAVLFQSHHKAHRDALIVTIEKMGGKPVPEKSIDDYPKALNAASLKNRHAIDSNRIGPRHAGVAGRRAGSIAAFNYSAALRASGLVWTAATLDRWLADPEQLVPGQQMSYRLDDPAERTDVIAYLLTLR